MIPGVGATLGAAVARSVTAIAPFVGWVVVALDGGLRVVSDEADLARVLHESGPLCWVICGAALEAAA